MGVKIGDMRSVVQFKVNAPTAAGAGFTDSWSNLGTVVRGAFKAKSGRKTVLAGEVDFFNYYELFIRYQQTFSRSDLLVVIDEREFTIDAPPITIDEGKKTYLKFTLAEKINA